MEEIFRFLLMFVTVTVFGGGLVFVASGIVYLGVKFLMQLFGF